MYIEKGDMSEDVSDLQEKLISLGYSCGAGGADGEFGDDTFNAVVRFQRDHGLDADGIVGDQTWSTITAELNGGSFPLLQKGASGSSVVTLQKRLIALGYDVGSDGADGDYGDNTVKAVTNFQKDHGLEVDGVAGPNTWTELNALSGGNNSSLLRVGSKGDEVKRLQSKLIMLGYSVGSDGADGDYGDNTYNAVVQFQEDCGLEVDGIVGPQTWAMINNVNAGIGSELLKLGSSGDTVKSVQKKLISLGYDCGPDGADGDYGQNTYNAVCKFQGEHNLEVDGVVGPNTFAELNAASVGSGSSLLKRGSSGDSVKLLQTKLIALGYDCGSSGADGDFGDATYDAVIAFQTKNNLEVDGVVGPQTWIAINTAILTELNPSPISPITADWCTTLVRVARKEVGTHEGIDNNTKYGDWYGQTFYPNSTKEQLIYAFTSWCAEFVSWCANQAGILDKKIPHFAYCPNGVSWYKGNGLFRTAGAYVPYAGDTIFFSEENSGRATHTGIISEVLIYDQAHGGGTKIRSIEGNWSDQVCENERDITATYIYGYGINGNQTRTTDEISE